MNSRPQLSGNQWVPVSEKHDGGHVACLAANFDQAYSSKNGPRAEADCAMMCESLHQIPASNE